MLRSAVLVALAAGVISSCGSGDSNGTAHDCRPVVALVASSMVGAFGELAGNQCADSWKITGGSSTALAAQVREGSPADVFVAAGTSAVMQLENDGLTVGDAVPLGSVRATLYVGQERAETVTLRQLPRLVADRWKVGACVASAPCGVMADQIFANASAVWGAGYDRRSLVATEAESAADLVAKVAMGELDAALIYEYVCVVPPNAQAVGRCSDIPDDVDGRPLNVSTPYVAVRLRQGENADSFMEFVTSSVFRTYLRDMMRVS